MFLRSLFDMAIHKYTNRNNPMQSDLPNSKSFTGAVMDGKVIISEECPSCHAKCAWQMKTCLMCFDCYQEF